MFKILSD